MADKDCSNKTKMAVDILKEKVSLRLRTNTIGRWYELLSTQDRYQVKDYISMLVVLEPTKHYHRSEHWIMVKEPSK